MTTRIEAQAELESIAAIFLNDTLGGFDWEHEMKNHFAPSNVDHWFGAVGAAAKYGISEETAPLRCSAFCEYTRSPLYIAVENLFGAPENDRGAALLEVARYLEAHGPDPVGAGRLVGHVGRLLRAVEAAPVAAPAPALNAAMGGA